MVTKYFKKTIHHRYLCTTLLFFGSLIAMPAKSCALQDLPFYTNHEESYALTQTPQSVQDQWLAPEDIIDREIVTQQGFLGYQYQIQRLRERKWGRKQRKRNKKASRNTPLIVFPDDQALETLSSSCWMFNSFSAQSGQSLNVYIQNRLQKLTQRLAKKNIVLVLVSPDFEDQDLYSYYWLGSRASIDTLIMQLSLQFGEESTPEWLSITEQSATVTPQLWNTMNRSLVDHCPSLGLRDAVNETSIHDISIQSKKQLASKYKSTAPFVLGIPCHYKG